MELSGIQLIGAGSATPANSTLAIGVLVAVLVVRLLTPVRIERQRPRNGSRW